MPVLECFNDQFRTKLPIKRVQSKSAGQKTTSTCRLAVLLLSTAHSQYRGQDFRKRRRKTTFGAFHRSGSLNQAVHHHRSLDALVIAPNSFLVTTPPVMEERIFLPFLLPALPAPELDATWIQTVAERPRRGALRSKAKKILSPKAREKVMKLMTTLKLDPARIHATGETDLPRTGYPLAAARRSQKSVASWTVSTRWLPKQERIGRKLMIR